MSEILFRNVQLLVCCGLLHQLPVTEISDPFATVYLRIRIRFITLVLITQLLLEIVAQGYLRFSIEARSNLNLERKGVCFICFQLGRKIQKRSIKMILNPFYTDGQGKNWPRSVRPNWFEIIFRPSGNRQRFLGDEGSANASRHAALFSTVSANSVLQEAGASQPLFITK
jgi:hypothetical protein